MNKDLARIKKLAHTQSTRKITPAEKALCKYLKNNNIRFKFNKTIYPYFVDFLFPRKMLIVELDGGGHYKLNQATYDAKRDNLLMSLGFLVIRFSNQDVLNNFGVVLDLYNSRKSVRFNIAGEIIKTHNMLSTREDFSLITPQELNEMKKVWYKYLQNKKRELIAKMEEK